MQMGLSETVYHGGIPAISLEAGETKVVELKPADNRTSVKVKIEKDPYTVSKWAALLLLSRNPGLLTWAGKSFYHLEDECLARVMRYTLNSVPSDSSKRARWGAVVSSDDTYAFRNFPPGTYAVLAITWGKYEFEERPFEAAYIRGAKVELSSGSEKTVEIPWVEPEGPSPMNSRVFYDVVELQAKQYTAQELCDLLSDFLKKKTGSDARIAADPTVRQEKIALPQAKLQIWDLLEKVYLDKAWRLEPDYKNRMLILRGVER
jgi:hypothetical protein